ncbi:MAG: hypothetical protein J5710_00985 [Treponema sp.]|nr:hypothetical protein [Treponema sp.]MBR5645210.1 hypothetical protein [Treponema sp.]
MKKRFLFSIVLLFLINGLFAESNADKFWNFWNGKDEEAAVDFLKEWEKKNKKDPELYVCYFNMYVSKAAKEQMYVESSLPPGYDGQYIEGQNEKGNKIYMYSIVEYDDDLSAKAFEYIDKGLSYNPKRLDMHFGKAHFYFMRKEYDKQADVIKNTFKLNKKYKNSWLWSNNVTIKSANVGFAASIHEYILKWYNTQDESVFPFMKEISELYVEQYPDDVIAYNDAGISAMFTNDLLSAKKYFKKGYELDPSDMILLGNLARICFNLEEIEEAYNYYKIMAASDNPDDSEYAKNILKQYFNE